MSLQESATRTGSPATGFEPAGTAQHNGTGMGTAAGLESTLARVLAEVRGVDRVSVDDHFFNDLGADSLVMAQFCARARKRGDLPPISMKDIYAHPTIRGLAVALQNGAPRSSAAEASPRAEAPTQTSTREYITSGVLQGLLFLAYAYGAILAIKIGDAWVTAAPTAAEIYLRLVGACAATFVATFLLPIAAKWLLIGRWKPRQMRLWSLAYVRFWIVKTLVRSSPAARLFIGTPLYLFYLRALGAKIGPGVVIFSRAVPVCTDLLSIGAGTVIRREAVFSGYRANGGRIEIGSVHIGRNAFVGDRSVLDINTAVGDGAQLGHASALASGQAVPAGERWHGSPAQRTDVNYLRVPPARCGVLRRAVYTGAFLLGVLLVYLPLVTAAVVLAITEAASLAAVLAPGAGATAALFLRGALVSVMIFFGLALLGFVLVVTVPRLLRPFITPDRVYPLYGFHDLAHRAVARLGGQRFYTFLFGDSSYIVSYLRLLGHRLTPVEQTGSNFGIEEMHSNPFLCSVGTGTMVADGLMMVNDEVSSTSFRVSAVTIGPRNFLGNDITYPAGGRTGDNCLLATKVLVPLDGEIRQGVGLLGSPSFEIPRSVERDAQFDHLRTGEALRRGLAAKKRHNVGSMGVYLAVRLLSVFVFAVPYLAAMELYNALPLALCAALLALSTPLTALYFALVNRIVVALHPVRPTICSIYHPDFWSVELQWKLHPIHFFDAFDGTPFKNLLRRVMGTVLGRRVFDDGCRIPEPTVTAIGDECVLNYRSKIQCHSQEDGTFKVDRTTIGARCTLGVGALVHYGVTMGDGAVLAADSFLMKGEEVPAGALWGGNPATEVRR